MNAPDYEVEMEYLADSQFDYPHSDTGWQYQTLDSQNTFGLFKQRDLSRETATPFAFLVCEDPNCEIGRDFIHPGYTCRPSLQWNAIEEGKYLVEGEVAFLRSTASGNLCVSIYVDDVRVLSKTISYPESLSFAIPLRIKASGFVRIVFACLKIIDNNHCFYSARIKRISDISDVTTRENQSEYISIQSSPALRTLQNTLREIVPMPMNEQQLSELTLNPFGQFEHIGKTELYEFSERLLQEKFSHQRERFHLPRYFSVKKNR